VYKRLILINQPSTFRPKLQTSLDAVPALARNPYSMTHYLPLSLSCGPPYSDKGKAKEILFGSVAPPWYPEKLEDEEAKLEGSWWGAMAKDDALVAGLPSIPAMVPYSPKRRKGSIPRPRHTSAARESATASRTASITKAKPISLGRTIQTTVDKLFQTRQDAARIVDIQRIEADGGVLPPLVDEKEERRANRMEHSARKRKRKAEKGEADQRRAAGGEMGEEEAALAMKRAGASLLAHAGFDGE
jgi:transcriptional activator SPT7